MRKVLLILVAVRVAAMLVAPVFEPSEARYAAISANMARTGDWFVPSFTYKGVYQPFAGKPPFAFQASALSCKALGGSVKCESTPGEWTVFTVTGLS